MTEEERLRREEIEARIGPHIRSKLYEAIDIRESVASKDAMDFFAKSGGNWSSVRCTHHLAFQETENGASNIKVEVFEKDHPKVVELCGMHGVDSSLAAGGAFVSWQANLDWDKEGDSHDGETFFVVVPESEDGRRGKLLRDRGYAEKIPVAGDFYMDDDDSLVLITEYDVMSVHEKLFFDGTDRRYRTSTVKMYGGFTTATVAVEARATLNEDGTSSQPFNEQDELKAIVQKIKNITFKPFPPAPPKPAVPAA
eukprot:CAMPEP_0196654916 /NCGR_PEP_ID=MMETSP1086-20130531/4655_1 /TAXON_ID=77921 /ORGANISM="Cyanoptyche  gloeocystis , Strain SAG4.97" /LENGTH=253 /DNA_ID=CAMNT_0041986951 /DNA_START=317 /DNA_END=1078 /DNA_ORIENTATION=-